MLPIHAKRLCNLSGRASFSSFYSFHVGSCTVVEAGFGGSQNSWKESGRELARFIDWLCRMITKAFVRRPYEKHWSGVGHSIIASTVLQQTRDYLSNSRTAVLDEAVLDDLMLRKNMPLEDPQYLLLPRRSFPVGSLRKRLKTALTRILNIKRAHRVIEGTLRS
jgi:hypothetical protein